MKFTESDVDNLLPLQPAAFHILLALSGGEAHGYRIIHDVEARTGGALRLSPGTLYRTIHRLLEDGLIDEPRRALTSSDDPRRRYYRITAFGMAAVRAETDRLSDLVRIAKGALRVARDPA